MSDMSDYAGLTREELLKELEKKDLLIASLKKEFVSEVKNEFKSCSLPKQDLSLDLNSIKRYSRQLILPELGPVGQKKLLGSSVLIVGCGGLGCPAAVYLAAAGIGTLGLVDYDEVEISNLHRQILHTECRIGMPKAFSIIRSIHDLNSKVACVPYIEALTSQNIMGIIKNYDIVLDCTDNVATRYLLNDACILSHKPLVSGSALRFDGQLTVYGLDDGPCYRCLFPTPPPPETVTNCSDGGVLGVVPGVIGVIQALETIKILVGIGDICSRRMILLDSLNLSIRNVKLRGRQPNCELCGSSPVIKTLIDYEQFCGGKATDKDQVSNIISPDRRISVKKYKDMVDSNISHILVDVRNPVELEICSLPNTLNVPLRELTSDAAHLRIKDQMEHLQTKTIVCVCRRGNDSQIAVKTLSQVLDNYDSIVDIAGGLTAWSNKIDPEFPVY